MIPLRVYKGLVILLAIAVLVAIFWWGIRRIRHLELEVKRQTENLHMIVQAPGKTTAEFTGKKKEFKELFPLEAKQLDSLKASKRVQVYHRIEYRDRVDTILIPMEDGSYPEPSPFDGNVWTFEKDCATVEISKADSSDQLNMSLTLTPTIDIVTDLYRPKRWFIKFQWFKFTDSTTVTTPCGWEIKKNVRFNFK